MNFSTLKLASFVALTFVCAHWMACGLYMITALEPHAVGTVMLLVEFAYVDLNLQQPLYAFHEATSSLVLFAATHVAD